MESDTVWLIMIATYFCCLYVRDLYRASKDFEDFEGGGRL